MSILYSLILVYDGGTPPNFWYTTLLSSVRPDQVQPSVKKKSTKTIALLLQVEFITNDSTTVASLDRCIECILDTYLLKLEFSSKVARDTLAKSDSK